MAIFTASPYVRKVFTEIIKLGNVFRVTRIVNPALADLKRNVLFAKTDRGTFNVLVFPLVRRVTLAAPIGNASHVLWDVIIAMVIGNA